MKIQLESDFLVMVKPSNFLNMIFPLEVLFREAKFLLDTQFISFDVNYVF